MKTFNKQPKGLNFNGKLDFLLEMKLGGVAI